jgi:hypothetical protein
MRSADVRRLPVLPADIKVVDEDRFGPEACGLDGFTNRLLTARTGDSAKLLARLRAALKADGWKVDEGYRPIVVARSSKRGLSIDMLTGADEAVLVATQDSEHPSLIMNDAMSARLKALVAQGAPVVLFRVDTCHTDDC